MSLLKQIDDKGAVLSWSPLSSHPNLVALGTKDSAGTGFDDHGGELELHLVDFSQPGNLNTKLLGKSRASSRFSSMAWSQMGTQSDAYPYGLIAGGMLDGTINIWNPAYLQDGNEEDALLATVEQHNGGIPGLAFNPHRDSSHLLASGGNDGEVYITSIEQLEAPTKFEPAPNQAKHTADITQVAWNSQVAHILASAAQNGSCFVWDLRQKRAWCELRDPSGACVSDVAWNPDQGLHLVTASGDDRNPVIKLWDLRSSTSLPLATLQGHTEGVLSVSWCPNDTSLLLSCGKDNRTILWDLFHLQPVYELPMKDAQSMNQTNDDDRGMYGGFSTPASNRRYHVSWSPTLPAVVATSSFDRKVQFYSMTGARSKLGRAPKWLRKPVGATFGFGGKLVMIDNFQGAQAPQQAGGKKAPSKNKLKVFQIAEDVDLVKSSDRFHEMINKNQHKEYCDEKSVKYATTNHTAAQVWSLMNVICFGQNAREELLTYLGFDGATIRALANKHLSKDVKEVTNEPLSPPMNILDDDVNASDVFGTPATTTATTTSTSTSTTNNVPKVKRDLTLEDEHKVSELLDLIKSGEEAEPVIRKAIVVGDFELAVECCFKAGLLAEALLLAQCGDADLRARTQATFFDRQRHKHPFLNVLHAVIKSQLMEYVLKCDLTAWKECLALLSTYGKSEDFSALCEALATRLENELQDRSSATLCFMCAANVSRTIKFWTDELEEANQAAGQLDIHALQDYVEKILVFTHVNPVAKLEPETGAYFARYAELLASQGRLSAALIYLKGGSFAESVLLDRLFHSGSKAPGAKPPAFPFTKVNVEAQAKTPVSSQRGVGAGVVEVKQSTTAGGRPAMNVNTAANATAANAGFAANQQPVKGPTNTFAGAGFNPAAVTNQPYGNTAVVNNPAVAAVVQQPPAPVNTTPSLPPGWIQLIDPASNRPYFVNQQTGVSQWEPPVPVPAPAPVAQHQGFQQPQHQPQVQQFQPQQHQQPQVQQFQPQQFQQQQQPQVFNPQTTMQAKPAEVATAPVVQQQPAAVVAPVHTVASLVDADHIIALGQLIEALSVGNLGVMEKKQLTSVRGSYEVLKHMLNAGQISEDVQRKINILLDALFNRNFQLATSVQADLVSTVWDTNKEWLKGIKVLIQLNSKK